MQITKIHCAVIALLCVGVGYSLSYKPADNYQSKESVVRNLVVALKKSAEQTQQLRSSAFSGIDSIEQILQLPTVFDRLEAAYSLVGRSEAVELLSLLHTADRVADVSMRQRLQGVILSRLISLNPSLALEVLSDGSYFGEAQLIDAIWAEWSQNDFEAALTHAHSQFGSERKIAALALMAANGFMATARSDRIVEELGIHPNTHIRTQFLISLASESPMKAIDYLNDDANSWVVDDLISTFAYHMARRDVAEALELTELFANARARSHYKQIVLAHAAKEDPAAVLGRALSGGDDRPDASELYNAAHYMVEADLDAAMDYFRQLPKGDAQRILSNQIATKLADQDFDDALAWAQESGMSDNMEVLATVLQSHLSTDPERAMNHAVEFSRQGRSELLGQVLSRWTSLDPGAAMNWLKNTEFASKSTWTGIGTTLAYTELDVAKEFLGSVPAEFAMHWKQSIAQRMVSSGSTEEALRWAAQYKDDSDYSELMNATMQYVSHYDYESAISYTNSMDSSSERDQLYLAISQQATYRDTEKALMTAQKISEPGLRERALFAPTSYWFRNKPSEAERWLSNLDAGNQRDMAIVSAASTWSSPSSEQVQLISSISDSELQKHAWIMNLGNQMSENKSIDYSLMQQSSIDMATQEAITSVIEVLRKYHR